MPKDCKENIERSTMDTGRFNIEREEEGTRGRKEARVVRRREGQLRGVKGETPKPCHSSRNLRQRKGRRVEEAKYKFCYFPEQGIVMGNPGGEDGSPISVVSALRLTR